MTETCYICGRVTECKFVLDPYVAAMWPEDRGERAWWCDGCIVAGVVQMTQQLTAVAGHPFGGGRRFVASGLKLGFDGTESKSRGTGGHACDHRSHPRRAGSVAVHPRTAVTSHP